MSDDDNDKTPRGWVSKRPGRIQTSDDRALQHRQVPSSPGIPVSADGERDTTSPFDLFESDRVKRRRPSESVMQLAAMLRSDRRDPYDLVAEMAFEVVDVKQLHRSADSTSKQLDVEFRKFIERQPGGKEFDELRNTVKLWKWVGGAVLTLALGSVGLGLSALWSRAEHEGAVNTKIDRLEQDVQSLIRGEFAPRHQPKDTP